jgi:MFS family permease
VQAVTIYAGVLWVIPIVMFQQYTSLYMVQLGLSKTEIGVYQTLLQVLTPIGYFLGGYLADVWGRKKTLIFFDILSWGGYCVCLAVADNKWWCLAAICFLTTNAGSTPPYQSLIVENVESSKKASVITVLQLVNMTPALMFFSLIGGVWISKRGFLEANHEMYWFMTFMIAIGIFLRWKFLPPSLIFEKEAEGWGAALKQAWRQYQETMKIYLQKKGSKVFLVSKFIDEWIIAVWAVYSSLYIVNYLGLKDSYLSVLPLVSAYVAALFLFIVIPNLREKQVVGILGFDQLFWLASFAVLFFAVQGSESVLLFALASTGFSAVAGALYNSVSAAVWMNIMEEKERAKVVAATLTLIKLGIAASGFLGAFLYGHVSPVALLAVLGGLRILNFFLLRRVSATLSPVLETTND